MSQLDDVNCGQPENYRNIHNLNLCLAVQSTHAARTTNYTPREGASLLSESFHTNTSLVEITYTLSILQVYFICTSQKKSTFEVYLVCTSRKKV